MQTSSVRSLRIGELASRSGCSIPTIRYYEEIGLIPSARRSAAKQRLYGEEAAKQLMFIRRCRDFGFSIEQIRDLIALSGKKSRDCVEVRDIAKANLVTVREKLTELKRLELSLSRFIAACNSTCAGGAAPDCTIFTDIAGGTPAAGESGCCVPNMATGGEKIICP